MSNKVEDISIKNRIYYFFKNISNIKRLTNKLSSKVVQKKFFDVHVTYLYFKRNFFKGSF